MEDKRLKSTLDREEAFVVRHATSLEDLQWILKHATEEGWLLRAREADSYFTAGLVDNFFIGETNGERISCISAVRHGEALVFVSYYIVLKSFRGKGYGLQTWNAALGDISDKCNIQLFSVMNMRDVYKRKGFHPGWMLRRYKFTVSRAMESLSSCQFPSAKVLPAKEANFDELIVYGADMMGSSKACKSVLAAWLTQAQESSWVAIGNTGEILGYLIMSEANEAGYNHVAPFFADSVPIARSLLKSAVEFATHKSETLNFFLEISPDYNPDGVNFMEKELGAKPMMEVVQMGTKELHRPHEKIFGRASIDIM